MTTTSKTDDEMFYRITNGKEGTAMGPFRDKIAPDEIRRIIVYLRSLAGRRDVLLRLVVALQKLELERSLP